MPKTANQTAAPAASPAIVPAPEGGAPVSAQPAISEKFLAQVEKQFKAELGSAVAWSPLERTLGQHMFVKIDQALAEAETRRASNQYKKNDPPITWANVNMTKLATDVVHTVHLELDAYVKNHLFTIPYLNKRTGKYDLDLRIGYAGVDHTRRKFSLYPILDITYQLVHEGDEFEMYRDELGIQRYRYQPANYFKPKEVIGGFGYVQYEDPRRNVVVVVEYREFEKAMKASGGTDFWGGEQTKWENGQKVKAGYDEKFRKEMQYKTVVHRVCSKIALDPAKVNTSMLESLEAKSFNAIEADVRSEMDENANKDTISVDALPEPTVAVPVQSTQADYDRETGEKQPEPSQATQASLEEAIGY